jgi:hypothetical protein
MKKTTNKNRTTKTTYVPVSNNVYFDGVSYRVRASIDGTKHSKNFTSKRNAIQFRNKLLSGSLNLV